MTSNKSSPHPPPPASPMVKVKDQLQPVCNWSSTSRSREATSNRTGPNLERPDWTRLLHTNHECQQLQPQPFCYDHCPSLRPMPAYAAPCTSAPTLFLLHSILYYTVLAPSVPFYYVLPQYVHMFTYLL